VTLCRARVSPRAPLCLSRAAPVRAMAASSVAQDGLSPVRDGQDLADTADEEKLHAMLLAAASDVCGSVLANQVFGVPRERPRRTASGKTPPAARTQGADFKCHAPVTLFRRLYATATKSQREMDGVGIGKIHTPENVSGPFAEPFATPGDAFVVRRRADCGCGGASETSETSTFGASHDSTDNDLTQGVFSSRTRKQSGDFGEGICITSKTEYGTVRHRTYRTVSCLADAILVATHAAELGATVAHACVDSPGNAVAVDKTSQKNFPEPPPPRDTKCQNSRHAKPGGSLSFVTQTRLRRAASLDLLLCRTCQTLLQGNKGLREHNQVRHLESYETSVGNVREARCAMVVCTTTRAVAKPRTGHTDVAGSIPKGAGGVKDDASGAATKKTSNSKSNLSTGFAAARDGDFACFVDCLVTDTNPSGWDPVLSSAVDKNGSCALHWAAGGGSLEICEYLVEVLGEDPRRRQASDGRTAMHWAARNAQLEVCAWLFEKHAVSVNDPTNDGTTPFMWCVWGGGGVEESDDEEFFGGEEEDEERVLPVDEGEHEPLDSTLPANTETKKAPRAVRENQPPKQPKLGSRALTLSWLTTVAKADVHALNVFGCNASQWAAQRGKNAVAMCRYLQKIGTDLRLKNRNGHSALHKAAVKGNFGCCVWLLSHGNLTGTHLAPDGDGNTPGEMARLEGFSELARWLNQEAKRLSLSD